MTPVPRPAAEQRADGDLIGAYRRGVGRCYLAWYFGPLDGGREEEHEAFAAEVKARRWLFDKAQSDPDLTAVTDQLWWEVRNTDGAQQLFSPIDNPGGSES